MATGDKVANLYLNGLLSKTVMNDWFLEFLDNKIDTVLSGLMQGRSGTLSNLKVAIAADGADKFKLTMTDASRVVVGGGQVIDLDLEDLVGHTREIPFENTVAVDYEVGIKYASVPSDLVLDPRKGTAQYAAYVETFGETGMPDSLVDTFGVSLRINIDSLCEAGVTHAGRLAKVWLYTPVSAVAATAFYEGVVQYDGVNYITIVYAGAAGPLGQDTGTNPPSTTVGDYRVLVNGPKVIRGASIKTDYDYAYIGTITGAGSPNPPAVFDTTDQFPVFLISRQSAYDGIGGGAGRVVNVASGAIEDRLYNGTALRPDTNYGHVWLGIDGLEWRRTEAFGRVADLPRFADDFHYNTTAWAALAGIPAHLYRGAVVGAASDLLMLNEFIVTAPNCSGVVKLLTDSNIGDETELIGPAIMKVRDLRPGGYFRFVMPTLINQTVYLLLKNEYAGAPDWKSIGFKIVDNQIYGVAITAAGAETLSAALGTVVVNTVFNAYFLLTGATELTVWVDGMAAPTTLVVPFSFDMLAQADSLFWSLYAKLQVDAGGAPHEFWLDYWETWTRGYILAA